MDDFVAVCEECALVRFDLWTIYEDLGNGLQVLCIRKRVTCYTYLEIRETRGVMAVMFPCVYKVSLVTPLNRFKEIACTAFAVLCHCTCTALPWQSQVTVTLYSSIACGLLISS